MRTKNRHVDKSLKRVAETDSDKSSGLAEAAATTFRKRVQSKDPLRAALNHRLACKFRAEIAEKLILDGARLGWEGVDRAFCATVVKQLVTPTEFRLQVGHYPESALMLHAASIGMVRVVDALRQLITSDIAAGVFEGPYPQDVWQLPHFALWCVDGGEPGPMRSPHRELAHALLAGSEDAIRRAVKDAAEWHVQHGRERTEPMEAEFQEHTLMPVEFWVLAARQPAWAKFFTPDVHPLFATPFATRPPCTYDPSQDKQLLQVLELTGMQALW